MKTTGAAARSALVLLGGLLLCHDSAIANETLARAAAGGLTFIKSDDISLVSEELRISRDKIKVVYQFLNRSSENIRSVVAFPFPEYGWVAAESPYDANEGPIGEVAVRVDGRTMRVRYARSAWLKGREVTADLKELGLTGEQIFTTFGDADPIEGIGLGGEVKNRLEKMGVVERGLPRWRVSMAAIWRQTFPSGLPLRVELTYRPFVGWDSTWVSRTTAPERGAATLSDWSKNLGEDACVTKSVRGAVIARATALYDKGAGTVVITVNDVEYVLGTGRNWKGPVGDFKLYVERKSEDEIVAVCMPGNSMELRNDGLALQAQQFIPPDRLVVAFYSVRADQGSGPQSTKQPNLPSSPAPR
jgi:hypothetical protein